MMTATDEPVTRKKYEMGYFNAHEIIQLQSHFEDWEPLPNTTYRLIINQLAIYEHKTSGNLKLLFNFLLGGVLQKLTSQLSCFVVQFNDITEAQLMEFFSQDSIGRLPRYVFKMGSSEKSALISWRNAIAQLVVRGTLLPNEIIFDLRKGVADDEMLLPLRKMLLLPTVPDKLRILYRTTRETNLQLTVPGVRANPPPQSPLDEALMNPPELSFQHIGRPRSNAMTDDDARRLSEYLEGCKPTQRNTIPLSFTALKRRDALVKRSIWHTNEDKALDTISEEDEDSLVYSETEDEKEGDEVDTDSSPANIV